MHITIFIQEPIIVYFIHYLHIILYCTQYIKLKMYINNANVAVTKFIEMFEQISKPEYRQSE
jgi:hypothetical protein